MAVSNHITRGKVCDFNFYVRALNSRARFSDYREPVTGISIQEAMKEFEMQCAENPDYVNTMLGLDFTTSRKDLEPHGAGSADLLQCIKGRLHLCEDYKLSEVLNSETLISVNAAEMLKKEAARLQRMSDNATEKCAKLIEKNISALSGDIQFRAEFFRVLAEDYGVERCKYILANELFGHGGEDALIPAAEYLRTSYDGKYNKRFGIFAAPDQISALSDTLRTVENGLTETEGKLHRAGLVNGYEPRDISDRASAVAGEIERHDRFEDAGEANEDGHEL